MGRSATGIVHVMTPSTPSAQAPTSLRDTLAPEGWLTIDGLVCGFGDRTNSAPSNTLLPARQVHGTGVLVPSHRGRRFAADPGDGYPRVDAEVDALVAAEAGTVVGVRTADCVPLLLAAPRERWSAAVHAGWRGTLAGIATEAVRAAREAGIDPRDLLAALGPSIGPCCYEVSEELGRDFERAGLAVPSPRGAASTGGQTLVNRSGDARKPHLDLRAANRILLERSGVAPANVQLVGPCTRCARDRFHSFRADPQSGGRQVSWVGWR